jgi:hypothetical protein
MANRTPITKSVRFEVFKRDSFACQYCGAAAPSALLHVDHIQPVAKGGTNELFNLVTACEGCNQGKSDRLLSDRSHVELQRKELEALQLRREQLEMMKEWRDSVASIAQDEVSLVESIFTQEYNVAFEPIGVKQIRRLITKHSIGIVLEAAQNCCEQYDDSSTAFSKLKTFCESIVADRELPGSGRIPYIVAVLKNRNMSCWYYAPDLIKDYLIAGGEIEELVAHCKTCKNWTAFKNKIEDFLYEAE